MYLQNGLSALMYASKYGRAEAIKLLLGAGAVVNEKDKVSLICVLFVVVVDLVTFLAGSKDGIDVCCKVW